MTDIDKAIELLTAVRDGKPIVRITNGQEVAGYSPGWLVDNLDHLIIADPKPTPEQLGDYELTGEYRIPVREEYIWSQYAQEVMRMDWSEKGCEWRWIVRPRDAPAPVVKPWELHPKYIGRVVVTKADNRKAAMIGGICGAWFVLTGHGTESPAELLRDWQNLDGSPCGEQEGGR